MILSASVILLLKCIIISYASATDSIKWQQYALNDNLGSNHLTYRSERQDLNSWGLLGGRGWITQISPSVSEWNPHQHQVHHTHAVPIGHHIEITKPIGVPVYKNIGIPLAQPIGIPITHITAIGIPQPYPVHVPIAHPVPIPVVKTVATIIEKKVPYPIEKIIPIPVEKPIPIPIEKHIPVPIENPYPIRVPIYKPILHRYKNHGWNR